MYGEAIHCACAGAAVQTAVSTARTMPNRMRITCSPLGDSSTGSADATDACDETRDIDDEDREGARHYWVEVEVEVEVERRVSARILESVAAEKN